MARATALRGPAATSNKDRVHSDSEHAPPALPLRGSYKGSAFVYLYAGSTI